MSRRVWEIVSSPSIVEACEGVQICILIKKRRVRFKGGSLGQLRVSQAAEVRRAKGKSDVVKIENLSIHILSF